MEGFLCINKNPGFTSRSTVDAILRQVRPHRDPENRGPKKKIKVGHAGTLDPLATGVLVIAVGRATKLIQFVQQMPKEYVGTFELGKTSDTEDITGEVVRCEVESIPTLEEVQQAIKPLIGQILQRPPCYSALHVDGRRAHELARKGEQFELEARPIVVHEIEIVRYEFPQLVLRIKCGSGTYVRSLGRDVGEHLGCGAVMTELVRTAVGNFTLENSNGVEDFPESRTVEDALIPIDAGTSQLPHVNLDEAQVQAISVGQEVTLATNEKQLAALDGNGKLVAILTRSELRYRSIVNFVAKN